MGKKRTGKGPKNPWGGRFSQSPTEAVREFTCSLDVDRRLYDQDIRGSLAHARMLRGVGLLTSGELKEIEKGLRTIRDQIESGRFRWKTELEDVHMNIESALTRLTPAGAKLHTGRSRNDQVATDMRLWVMEECGHVGSDIRKLQKSLCRMAEDQREILIPGYTHLQRAQPVYMAHHLLAYVEMLERDAGRFRDVAKRADVLPLGSGALAGSTLPLDRKAVAGELGFSRISANSLDAVSDRDFMVEFLSAAALLGVHLSRLAEDFILWASAEFGFIRIGDAYTTGSSLMPQKKNPDVAELVRGKTGRLCGNLQSLLVTLKGLPMTYNRDLQEDKAPLFNSADTVRASLHVLSGMIGDTAVIADRCQAAVSDPLLMATDVADRLVEAGIPFRQAHEIVGRAVAYAEKSGQALDQLDLDEWKKIHPQVTADCLKVFDPIQALQRRKMPGAPGKAQINRELKRWQKTLG
jgi:argininosuccinate lyase